MSQGDSSVGPGELMTPKEIHDFGVGVVAKQLEKEGYELISVDPRMGLHPQIVATHKVTKAFIAVRTAVYPGNGKFESLDAARSLVITAKTHGGIAYLASVNLAEVKVLGPSGPERLLPPSIDPQLLDETAATVAGALGVLDDLPQELANTVVNCYYRLLKFSKTLNPTLQQGAGTKTESAIESFQQHSRRASEAIADGEFIASSRNRTRSKSYTGLLDH